MQFYALKKIFIIFALLAALGIGSLLAALSAVYLYLSPDLPSVESIRDIRLQTPLKIYSSDGILIGEFGEKRRNPVKYAEIPQDFINALLAAEDANFFNHRGVSIKGLLRAASQILLTGRRRSGGSTITMQLTRNVFLTLEQTFSRKFNEILLAIRLEQELSKEEILELYVNLIFLGKRAYGIQAAAQIYYDSTINALSLAQMAMIAGLPQGPSTQNPIANPGRAIERRNWILGRMLELEFIDEARYQEAIAEPVNAKDHGIAVDGYARYAAEMARKEAVKLLGEKDAYTSGFEVHTTIDSRLQKAAQKAIVNGLLTYDKRHGFRGPEQRFPVEEAKNPAAADGERSDEDTANILITHLSQWHEVLANAAEYGGLEPAIVIDIQADKIKVLRKNKEVVFVAWEHGLAQLKPYIDENRVGKAPEHPADTLNIGDLIRIKREPEGDWWISQLPKAQAALVSIKPQNGAIQALVGGFDFRHSKYNRAIQARRQPGSNFKPFIYTAALESGFTPASIINDAPIVFEDKLLENAWRPENDSGKFYGPTRLRKALYLSRNLVSIRVMRSVGIASTLGTLSRFGFDVDALPRDLSVALGSHALTPLEIATGYAVFANGGYRVKPYLIQRVLDRDGFPIFEANPLSVCTNCAENREEHVADALDEANRWDDPLTTEPFQLNKTAFDLTFKQKSILDILKPEDYLPAPKVLDDRVAYMIDSMLLDVIRRGTGRKARRLGRDDIAGKTGTTNGPLDAWFSGYNGNLVTTTWLGFDQNLKLGRGEYGGSAALPIWIEYMAVALKDQASTRKPQPPGIVTVKIDPETGERALPGDPDAIFEIFRSENVPEVSGKSEETYGPQNSFTEELF